MTANECYFPAQYAGGMIRGVQATLTNTTGTTITPGSRNGIYYVYQGKKFQLLAFSAVSAGESVTLSKELYRYFVPNNDVKILIDTGGLNGLVVDSAIVWEL